MQVTESAAAKTTGVAHDRSSVERWLRWSGLVPLPAFLALHLGRELSLALASDVSEVVRRGPGVFAVLSSALLVWLPLALHCALGVWVLTSGKPRAVLSSDVETTVRIASRACSVVALLFIVYHARQYPLAALLGEADSRDAGFRLIGELSGTTWNVPARGGVYLFGLAASAAHAGLGVHRGLLAQGLLSSATKRRASARLCTVGAILLFTVGAAAVIRVASGVLLR
jgi:succinate dehydrogenase / fumarate reductase, cytochrome b subunit